MIDLGYDNLFTSEFDMGCELPNSKELEYIETLNKWLDFKKNDFWMEKYRPENTLFIAFLHIIDLETFNEILHDLILIYKKSYPFGKKSDFIEHTFRYTLRFLEKFNNIHYSNFIYYSRPNGIRNYIYYYRNHLSIDEIEDYILEQPKDIKFYQQYYKKIVELIINVDFDNINSETSIFSPQQTETKTDLNFIDFKNNFDNVDSLTVYKHFKIGLVDKQHLTEDELNNYFKVAFELKKRPEMRFLLKNVRKKKAILAVFYEYYKDIAGKPHKKQKEYASLLGEYFTGFKTETLITNFSKSIY